MKAQWMKAKSQRLKERYETFYKEPNKQAKKSGRIDKALLVDSLTTQKKELDSEQEEDVQTTTTLSLSETSLSSV